MPFRGRRTAICIHLDAKTACLAIDRRAGALREHLEVGDEVRALPDAGRREYNPREAG
jgi:S-adenosylhomocysteine hydrolase